MSEAMFKFRIRDDDFDRFLNGEAVVACKRDVIISQAEAGQGDDNEINAHMTEIDVPFSWIISKQTGCFCLIQRPDKKEAEDE